MSERIILKSIPSSSQVDGEIIYHLNDSDSQNKSIIIKKNHYFPSLNVTKDLKQNVGEDKEIKSELNIFNTIIPKQEGETASIINEQNTNINSPLNLENNLENHYYNIKFKKINLLESKKYCSNIVGDSNKNSEFENHFYSKNTNKKYNDQSLDEIPIISKIFSEQIKIPKNFINFNLFFDSNVYRPKVCRNPRFKTYFISQKMVPFVNEKPENTLNHYSKLNFNVPENFLINFNIKGIYLENIPLKQNDLIMNQINLKDMQNYINNICNNFSKNDLDFSNVEYIELKKGENDQPKNAEFLQRKRKNSNILDEKEEKNYSSEDIYPKSGKRKPFKKNHKNNNKKLSLKIKQLIKNNNKKNGPKINLYLNQIQINKNRLEQFPFCQLLNAKENIKIDLLKGITEKKEIIKIKRKPEIINHQNNLRYIINKKFRIIYEKNEDGTQYILFINGINILYLILYYYYQIQEEVKLINKYHYSHASNEKSNNSRNLIENLIKKCNKIVKEITKEDIIAKY